jgi:CRP-like cAMP-binding protein
MLSRPLPQRLPSPPALEDLRIERFKELLAQASIFCGITGPALEDLAHRFQVRTRSATVAFCSKDEPGDAMYLIFSGRVKVVLGGGSPQSRELTLATLDAGEFFGEMSLLDGSPRSATVISIDDTTLLVLTRDEFHEHLKRHPQTAINLLGELSRRLRHADEKIADLALHDVHARLVRTLERLARADGEITTDGLLLRRRPTQQDLANMIGSCRETISRTFTTLMSQGLVETRGRALLLTNRLIGVPEPVAAPSL